MFYTQRFSCIKCNDNSKRLSLIDSQDAIIGNPLYDVASLIDDVRIKMPNNLQDDLFEHYIKNLNLKLRINLILKMILIFYLSKEI